MKSMLLLLRLSLAAVCGCSAVAVAQEPPAPRAADLSLWRDASFQKRLQESYLAESDVEPRLDPDDRDQLQSVYELLGKEQVEAAVAALQQLRSGSKNAVFDFTLGNLHYQHDRTAEAMACFEAAIEKFPRFRRAHKNLGMLYTRANEPRKAAAALTRVIELGGGDAATYGLLGFAHGSLDDPLAAESAYRMANLLDPGTMDWKMGLARSFLKQKRYADLAALCSALLAKDPGRGDLWLLQANAYLGLEQVKLAAENFEMADRLGQASADSLYLLGDIHVNGGEAELAVDAYLRALAKAKEGPADRAIRGVKALVARNAHGPARQLLEQVQQQRGAALTQTEQKELLKIRARLAVAAGAGEEEAKVLAEVVALDPLDGEALLLLGQYHARTGHPEQAVFLYERAASLEKFEADAKVRHAQLLVQQGKYGEAVPLLKRAQQVQPREHLQQYLEQVERLAQSR